MPLEVTTFIMHIPSGYFALVPLALGSAGSRVVIHVCPQSGPLGEVLTFSIACGLIR